MLFSDGVPEWQYREEFFGDERWQALAIEQAARGASAREMAETMLKALERFARGNICADDVTIVVVRATGAGPTA